MATPKICIFTETYYPVIGGGETQARLLAEGLVANGFSVILLTRRSDPTLKKVEQFGEVTVYRLPPVGRGQLKKWGLMLSSVPLLIKLQRQYDVIFVSGFRIVGMAAVLVSKLFGKACVLKADSQGEMSGEFFREGLAKVGASPSGWPFRLFLGVRNLVLKRADAFTAISADIATELTTVGVPPTAIQMIPNSVDTTLFCPVSERRKGDLRDKLGLPQEGKIAIYTGRLVSYKGLPLLLRVWQVIQEQHPEAYLVLVGTGGLDIHNCEADLRAYAEANGLQDSVHFTGSVHAQRVLEYLQAADLFVFPTENDAFPSSLVEAMTCRLPVIATPVGAIKTIVTHQKNGLVVQPGDFQQLCEAIEMLLTDPKLAAQLGQAGWQTVQDNYSAEIVTRKYINVFHQVANAAEVTVLPVDYS